MFERGPLISAMRGEAEALWRVANVSRAELSQAIAAELERRLPPQDLRLVAAVDGPVEILRDARGIAHIYAGQTCDLYYGLGFAMAQDRLWQMDLLRRRGAGRLAEIMGPVHVQSDVTHRTLGFAEIVDCEIRSLPDATVNVLRSFIAGINRYVDASGDRLPIEFDLLDYRPEPWRPEDVLLALRGFWWQLNGRLASIVIGEAALRHLPEDALRDAFFTPEFAGETIVPDPDPLPGTGVDTSATGSNNWAVGRGLTRSGRGVIGSDPHLPFGLPSNWWECHLIGPEDDVAGAAWVGVPGVWFGRNQRIAWGLTNNNASLRDLYREELDDAGNYRDGNEWKALQTRTEVISVKGQDPTEMTVRVTARGPLVNGILPALDPGGDPPLSLRWVGQDSVDSVSALIALNRARDWSTFRAALSDWVLPTFNWVYADIDGAVGYQCASRIPVRGRVTRGFRDANVPADQWTGFIPYDEMPRRDDPAERFVASANNAPAGKSYRYPIYGAFASGDRATRIRDELSAAASFDATSCHRLQQDTFSLPAARLVPLLLARLRDVVDPDVGLLVAHLRDWSFRYDADEVAPVFFDMFTRVWSRRVASERFPAHLVPLVSGQGIVNRSLLEGDDLGWFAGDTQTIVAECAREAAREVKAQFGDDPAGWTWRSIHLAHFKHPLSNPVMAEHLDVGPASVSGGAATVRNTGLGTDPLFGSASGAEYQVIVDLGDETGFLACQNIGQSGQAGSPHYRDQFDHWRAGNYHRVALTRTEVETAGTGVVRLEPQPVTTTRNRE